ncbi:hypothetical protein Daesc_000005 [Daldinia eschscholtzii]|uniref:Exonuclease V n=1 Tax=Daldinia eschscholtzii TaxID=292717 RepID=A0AAX6MXS3_9PEZI
MASSAAPTLDGDGDGDGDGESDYGSDFSIEEENIVNKLLEDLGNKNPLLSNHTTTAPNPTHLVSPVASPASTIATTAGSLSVSSASLQQENKHHGSSLYARSGDALPARAQAPAAGQELRNLVPPLTVSDLSSGAWCELQYWYTLTLLPGGRKTRTAAMRGGTRVHQTLEDQVHTTVEVSIATKEEAFALRMWNVIQGLRTLRDTGMTRELEVWGIIEGQVVNGIIDEVSHESPNAAFEQELSQLESPNGFATSDSNQQTSILDFLRPPPKKIYLTDVKTRGSDRLPTGAALRPARVQLFLYHRLLGEMASGVVDFTAILDRYGLTADALFSDTFMAQVGDLHDEVFYDADSDAGGASSPGSTRGGCNSDWSDSSSNKLPQDLIKYRSISQMLPLLQSELRETFPQGAATLGELLAVQYRHRDDGRILGNNAFPNDPEALEGYLRENLKWWRGERDPDGVSIEETYKCRSCEFAERCQWRKDKEVEFLRKKRGIASVGT